MKLPIIAHISEADRRKVWDALRKHRDLRVRIKDIMPAPLIGNWSVGLGGVLEKLVGADPNPTGV